MGEVVTLQFGQCGTQIGHEFFNHLFEDLTRRTDKTWTDYNETLQKTFFSETQTGRAEARSVMIDMEPKAVKAALKASRSKEWGYDGSQHHVERRGSGNNWSYGFHVHASQCHEIVLNMVRKEVEKCDHFSGFLLLMSLAGGTGSGLGSYISGIIRDSFPRCATLSSVVVPYSSGEVAVQNYNALLSLSHLAVTSDGTILVHNNHLYDVCSSLLGVEHVTFSGMNNIAAKNMTSLLAPVPTYSQVCSMRHRNVLQEVLTNTSCSSLYKVLGLKYIPHVSPQTAAFDSFTWDGLVKRMTRMLVTGHHMEEGLQANVASRSASKFISNLLIMRGRDASVYDNKAIGDLTKEHLYPHWINKTSRCSVWKVDRPLLACDKSVCAVSNGASCLATLHGIERRARHMFTSRAYLHHYAKHGMEEDDFVNAFASVQNVLNAYDNL